MGVIDRVQHRARMVFVVVFILGIFQEVTKFTVEMGMHRQVVEKKVLNPTNSISAIGEIIRARSTLRSMEAS